MLQMYQHSGFQSLLGSTGLLRTIAPKAAAVEELMPRVNIETGVKAGKTYRADGIKQGTVALFTGCVMNSLLGSINRSTVRLLNAAGYDVIVPGDQICCGALANHAGLRETAKSMARKNLSAFPLDEIDAIIINR